MLTSIAFEPITPVNAPRSFAVIVNSDVPLNDLEPNFNAFLTEFAFTTVTVPSLLTEISPPDLTPPKVSAVATGSS